MNIKLKTGATLSSDNNHHGLSLAQWYKLETGEEIEINELPDSLLPLVDVLEAEAEETE
jgi:hypothetical protein